LLTVATAAFALRAAHFRQRTPGAAPEHDRFTKGNFERLKRYSASGTDFNFRISMQVVLIRALLNHDA
jgi:hypothetical protein